MKKTKTVIFTVSGRDFNAIMSVCSPATSRDGSRETLERIEVRLDNGQGIATAMDTAMSWKGTEGAETARRGYRRPEACDQAERGGRPQDSVPF